MGEYELQEERVNGYPLYKKAEENHYIYRIKSGTWAVAEERAHVDNDLSWIVTEREALLPTSEGVAWKFYDGQQWVPEGLLSVTGVEVSIATIYEQRK